MSGRSMSSTEANKPRFQLPSFMDSAFDEGLEKTDELFLEEFDQLRQLVVSESSASTAWPSRFLYWLEELIFCVKNAKNGPQYVEALNLYGNDEGVDPHETLAKSLSLELVEATQRLMKLSDTKKWKSILLGRKIYKADQESDPTVQNKLREATHYHAIYLRYMKLNPILKSIELAINAVVKCSSLSANNAATSKSASSEHKAGDYEVIECSPIRNTVSTNWARPKRKTTTDGDLAECSPIRVASRRLRIQ